MALGRCTELFSVGKCANSSTGLHLNRHIVVHNQELQRSGILHQWQKHTHSCISCCFRWEVDNIDVMKTVLLRSRRVLICYFR